MAEGNKKETKVEHKLIDFVKSKDKAARKIGHSLSDKRPRFKSFKSPGVK